MALSLVTIGSMILQMQIGFAMLETGASDVSNAQNVVMKNMVDACVSALGFWATGWAFAFGKGGGGENGFLGLSDFFLANTKPDQYLPWFIQFAFATNAATIFGGCIAGRTRFMAYVYLAGFTASFVYPVVAHWLWSDDGWLRSLGTTGAIDFSGSGTVHLLGAVVGLVGATMVGPRLCRKQDKDFRAPRGHRPVLSAIGSLFLWVGWYSFNSFATVDAPLENQEQVAGIVSVTTTIAGSSAALVVFFLSRIREEDYDVNVFGNTLLAGLVAITAPCAVVRPWASFIIGIVAGLLYRVSSAAVAKLGIDDPLDAISVHGTAGLWGMISVGLFADDGFIDAIGRDSTDYGLFVGGGITLLAVQCLASVCIIAWAALWTFLLCWLLNYHGSLRVSTATEHGGLDLFKHNCSAYPEFQLVTKKHTGDEEDQDADDGPDQANRARAMLGLPMEQGTLHPSVLVQFGGAGGGSGPSSAGTPVLTSFPPGAHRRPARQLPPESGEDSGADEAGVESPAGQSAPSAHVT